MTLPRDLDILRPWASRTIECRYTCLKGTLPATTPLTLPHSIIALRRGAGGEGLE